LTGMPYIFLKSGQKPGEHLPQHPALTLALVTPHSAVHSFGSVRPVCVLRPHRLPPLHHLQLQRPWAPS
jgi:hypothetical protein